MVSGNSRLLVFSGVHKRYRHIINAVLKRFQGSALIVQDILKGDFVGKYDIVGYPDHIIDLFNNHMHERDRTETEYYSDEPFPNDVCNRILRVDRSTLNADPTASFIREYSPDVVFSFGVGMLKAKILAEISSARTVNLHLGLSPYYRSSDTLLWPLYLQNPGHVGTTLHVIDKWADHGPLYHQQRTVFSRDDTIHDVFCKTLIQAREPAIHLLKHLLRGSDMPTHTPTAQGKCFLRGEFTPRHLAVIHQLIEEGMLRDHCSGKWISTPITLFSPLTVSQ